MKILLKLPMEEDQASGYGSNNLPAPLQDRHQYQMLVAKLRQKADRESQQQFEALKDSKLSHHTTKTMDGEPQQPQLIESTGGYVSPPKGVEPPQKAHQSRPKARKEKDSCPHSSFIGDKCVTSCRLCGIFLPKVSNQLISSASSSTTAVQTGSRTIRNENMNFQCCFPMTEILRTTYAECMKICPMSLHPQYIQMRKMLIEWLIEGGEQLKLATRTIFQAIVLHDRYMSKADRPLDFQNGMDEIDRFMINALACLFISAKNCEIDTQMAHSTKFMALLPNKTQKSCLRRELQTNNRSQRLLDAELEILQTLNWDCEQPISFNKVLEIFTCQGILFTSDRVGMKLSSPRTNSTLSSASSMNSQGGNSYHVNKETLASVEKYIDFFRLIGLQDVSFFNENQYTVACAIISTARMHSKVQPVWAPELVQLSGLQHHHFLNIEQKIIEAFEQAIPTDSQYSQGTTSSQLQNSQVNQRSNANEKSDVFEADEIEKMLNKSKGVSSHQKNPSSDLRESHLMSASPSKPPATAKAKPGQSRFKTDQKPFEKISDFELRPTNTSDFSAQEVEHHQLRGREMNVPPKTQTGPARRQPLGDFRSREREVTTLMKWPQGRPGLNGDNISSGQKAVNIRRRDVSMDMQGVAATEQQRDRRTQFKVERGPNIPPRPGATNRPLRSKKPNSALGSAGYNSAQKPGENRMRETSMPRNTSNGPNDRIMSGNRSRETLHPPNRIPTAKYGPRVNASANSSRAVLPRTTQQQSSKVRAHPSLMSTSQKNLQAMVEQQELMPQGQPPPLNPVRDGRVTSQNARIAANQTGSHANIDGLRKLQVQTSTAMQNPRKHQFAPTTRNNEVTKSNSSSSMLMKRARSYSNQRQEGGGGGAPGGGSQPVQGISQHIVPQVANSRAMVTQNLRSGSAAVDHSQRYLAARGNNYKLQQLTLQATESHVTGPGTPQMQPVEADDNESDTDIICEQSKAATRTVSQWKLIWKQSGLAEIDEQAQQPKQQTKKQESGYQY